MLDPPTSCRQVMFARRKECGPHAADMVAEQAGSELPSSATPIRYPSKESDHAL
jgi:hypothetical protein